MDAKSGGILYLQSFFCRSLNVTKAGADTPAFSLSFNSAEMEPFDVGYSCDAAYSPCKSKAWFIGPLPSPKSSIAANAPEI